ncbi:MAG TPA: LL-diaminopimelate aminotransferase [Ruminococcus sp.]|nr:LL-diaminopimelate aminotransferase [Ruminococcus sp.]
MRLNENIMKLEQNYLFAEIAMRVRRFREEHPEAEILSLGINDVTRPLAPAVSAAMSAAAAEMRDAAHFHGYGDVQGEAFLREAVCGYYRSFKVRIGPEDVFISDGAKSDLANLCDLFAPDSTVLLPNPVYPVFYDTSVMAGRQILFSRGTKENGFLPMPEPGIHADLIYLCSPNNPTGAVYSRAQLQAWVEYAHSHHACIIYDAAYEAYIRNAALPRSIFEIAGAETCAIEINSFSKMAGFTGVRCSWVIIPRALNAEGQSLHRLWMRRQSTKYNGTSYIVQRGAAAVFSQEGQRQVRRDVEYYMENADLIRRALKRSGVFTTGGEHAPYVWMECPYHLRSWECFERLLSVYGIVSSPGAGFGKQGEGWLRFSSFGSRETIGRAAHKLAALDWDQLALWQISGGRRGAPTGNS